MKRLTVGATYRITKDFTPWAKEGHEPGGMSKVAPLSAGNSFKVLAARDGGRHGWYEAQVTLAETYEPPYGGRAFSWRGEILVSTLHAKNFTLAKKAKAKAKKARKRA